MKRRSRKTLGSVWQKALTSMTRTALRSGAKTFRQALASVPKVQAAARPKVRAKRRPPTSTSLKRATTASRARTRRSASTRAASREIGWSAGVAIAPAGVRRFTSTSRRARDAATACRCWCCCTGAGRTAPHWPRARHEPPGADRALPRALPEQDRLANGQGCWNWFDTRNGRAQREAAIIDAAIEQVCIAQPVDRARIAIAGLSAGGGMAALLATLRPERFLRDRDALGHRPRPRAFIGDSTERDAWTAQVMLPLPRQDSVSDWPPLLVIQGSADRVVAAENGAEAARLWAAHAQARTAPSRVVQRGTRQPATLTDYRAGTRLVARLCVVEGLGHAWSGGAAGVAYSDPAGPDASRMIWRFVASRFARDEAPDGQFVAKQ
jgi:poly(3-hydroxybutyrate) depolymerase